MSEDPGSVTYMGESDAVASTFSLMSEKEELERQMAHHSAVLTRHDVTMTTPLVDSDGFPRDDIDVYAVRHARAAIRRLQTDHTRVMRRLEVALHGLHAESPKPGLLTAPSVPHLLKPGPPILHVADVLPHSPAAEAGLRSGDRVCQLGSARAANFSGDLVELGRLLSHSRDQWLSVVVLRDGGETISLRLKPRYWNGRGLVGCAFVPCAEQPQR